MRFNVNTHEVVALTNRLEKMGKTSFPNAVRSTLNSAAFDVKQKTMPEEAEIFVKRKPNFFKFFSKVEKATGNNIHSMESRVGFSGKNQAVEDLEQQEKGGKISGRAFIPFDTARVSNSNAKLLRSNAILKKIKLVDAAKARGKNDREKFIKSVLFAGVGGHVLAKYKDTQIVWRVNSLNRNAEGGFKLTKLYSYEKGRKVSVEPTHFMERASEKTYRKMDSMYLAAAQHQFKKLMR
jgi:hypothetical protein